MTFIQIYDPLMDIHWLFIFLDLHYEIFNTCFLNSWPNEKISVEAKTKADGIYYFHK